jgi:glycosyltransferase involved in cell wall biosynthesis
MSAWPMRVTQVVFDLHGGGMESLVHAMAAHWRGTAVTISLITLSGRVGHVGEKVRSLVQHFQVLRLARGLSMLAPTGLAAAIRATRPDVVHLHTGAWLKGAYAARLAGVPWVVYTEHGREHNDPPLARLQDRLASQWTNRVVTVSPRLARYMTTAVGVSPHRIVTIPNGVDTTCFAPGAPTAALRASLDIPENALVLGSVGRFEPVKAYSRLVASYAALRAERPDRPLYLVLFGDGSDRAAIEREVDRLGVRDGVRLPGWSDHVIDAYRMLDVFAMTSTSEGMSISLMEAMACGIAPVVTDVGSNAEVLGASLSNQVVREDSPDAFTARIRALLDSPREREAASAQSRARAVAAHSLARTLGDYERLYHREAFAAVA